MATFNPNVGPDVGSSGNHKFRVLKASFGDGYQQTAADGINNREAEFSLVWTDLNETDFNDIWDFLVARNGYESFYYTLPNRSSAEKFRCEKFKETYQKGNLRGITATFIKDYTL